MASLVKAQLKGAFESTPICTVCSDHKKVDCLGGGSLGKYAYMCHGCNKQWQQLPPRDVPLFGDTEEEPIQRALPGEKKRSNGYKCKKCGQKKKTPDGRPHKCLGFVLSGISKRNLSKQSTVSDSVQELLSNQCLEMNESIFESFSECLG